MSCLQSVGRCSFPFFLVVKAWYAAVQWWKIKDNQTTFGMRHAFNFLRMSSRQPNAYCTCTMTCGGQPTKNPLSYLPQTSLLANHTPRTWNVINATETPPTALKDLWDGKENYQLASYGEQRCETFEYRSHIAPGPNSTQQKTVDGRQSTTRAKPATFPVSDFMDIKRRSKVEKKGRSMSPTN